MGAACCTPASLQFIGLSPLNHVLNPSQLRELSAVFELKTYDAGSQLFAADTPQNSVIMIVEGEVELLSGFSVLCVKRRNNFLGLNGVIKGRHTFSARAKTAARVVSAPMARFEEQVYGFEKFVRECVLTLCGDSGLVNPLLRRLDFLEEMDDFDLRLVSAVLTPLFFNPGQVVFAEGSDGKDLYVVQSGTVQAIHVRDSKEFVLTEFKAGDIFGELALFLDIPRSAMVRANRPCLLLQLAKDDFVQFTLMLGSDRLNFKRMVQQRISEQFRKYKLPFFESIPPEKYDVLATMAQVKTVDPDVVLFRQGDVGDAFYIIAFGEMRVHITKSDGKTEEVARMGPGKYFGEIALVREAPRTATVISGKRSVLLMIGKDNFNRFFSRAPEAIADFEVKLARTDCHIRSVLYHPIGLKFFEKHLNTEFSIENVTFWKSCRDYRHLASKLIEKKAPDITMQLQAKANEILNLYITEDAATQVNIPSPVRKAVTAMVKAGKVDPDTFLSAETEILNLMNTDSFARYRHTQLFQDFLAAVESYHLDWDLDHNIDTHVKAKLRSGSNAMVDTQPGTSHLSTDYALRVSKSTEQRLAAQRTKQSADGKDSKAAPVAAMNVTANGAPAPASLNVSATANANGGGAFPSPSIEPLSPGGLADRAQLAALGCSDDYASLPREVRKQRLSVVHDSKATGLTPVPEVAGPSFGTDTKRPSGSGGGVAAASSPLPVGWTEHEHDGKRYYYNAQTRTSTYQLPAAVTAMASAALANANANTSSPAATAAGTDGSSQSSAQPTLISATVNGTPSPATPSPASTGGTLPGAALSFSPVVPS